MSTVQAAVEKARTRARHRLLNHRLLSVPYLRAHPTYRRLTISSTTRVVIDGYPRSANSYAMFAFLEANPRRGELAGHTHSPQLLRNAVSRGLPTILLLRNPGAACASYAQYLSISDMQLLFDSWTRFHQVLRPRVQELLVAPFDTVVSDFGEVIREYDRRFATGFAVYSPTPENEQEVRRRLDHSASISKGLLHHRVARPSATRRSSDEILQHLDSPARRSLERATSLYEDLRGHAPFHVPC